MESTLRVYLILIFYSGRSFEMAKKIQPGSYCLASPAGLSGKESKLENQLDKMELRFAGP